MLLRHVLGLNRAALYTYPERPITPAERRRFTALLNRRLRGEPVAYLTGQQEFMGLSFLVNRHVLIPRPETEQLVDLALAHVPGDGRGLAAVDVGTGSGAIAIALAAARAQLDVTAIDVSADALAVARANARRLLGARQRRVRFVQGSLLAPLTPTAPRSPLAGPAHRIHVIAANLPYVAAGDVPHLSVAVRDFEPALALDGGPDGLDVYRTLLQQALEHLAPGGALLMECDPRQAHALADLAVQALPGASTSVHRDLSRRDRVVQAITPR